MVDPEEDPEHFISLFAPILHFHPKEGRYCCFPSDAEAVYETYADDWTRFKGDRVPKTLDPKTPCYYEFWKEPNMIQIKFWFWYNYNRFPRAPLGRGEHIGDWEHVEVRHYMVNSETPGTIYLLSNHLEAELVSHPGSYTLPGFIPQQGNLANHHVHVWVALGSHANYSAPSGKRRTFHRLWRDRIKDGGPVWYTEGALKLLDETNFASFEGRWGDDRSPRSPKNPYNNRSRNAPLVGPIRYTPYV